MKRKNQKRKPLQMVVNQKVLDIIEDPDVIEYIVRKLMTRRPWPVPWRLWKALLWIILAPATKEEAKETVLDKLRIVAELEGSHPMRLQPVGAPDAPHAGLADAGCPRHGARGPVRGVGRLLVQRHLNHLLHAVVSDGARLARPRRILPKGRDAARQKAAPPSRHLLWC